MGQNFLYRANFEIKKKGKRLDFQTLRVLSHGCNAESRLQVATVPQQTTHKRRGLQVKSMLQNVFDLN